MDKLDKIGRLLVEDGVLSEAKLKQGLEKQEASFGKPLGEVLLESGLVKESDFLRVLAKQFRTQYVTTDTLAGLNIPDSVLKMVPQEMAEKHTILPILYKASGRTLTIATADPNNIQAIDEVKFTSGVSKLDALIAQEESIIKGIKKFYKGDENAFQDVLSSLSFEDTGFSTGSGVEAGFGDSKGPELVLDEPEAPDDEDSPLELDISSKPSPTPEKPDDRQKEDGGIYLDGMEQDALPEEPERTETTLKSSSAPEHKDAKSATKVADKAKGKKYRKRMLVVEPHDQIRKFITKLFSREGFDVSGVNDTDEALQLLKEKELDVIVIKERFLKEGTDFEGKVREINPKAVVSIMQNYGSAMMGETRLSQKHVDAYFNTLDVVIGLLEVDRESLQGHTHKVAKYVKLLVKKLDLTRREFDEAVLAAYVHDLGRKTADHLTVLDVEKSVDEEGLRDAADISLRLLAGSNLTINIEPTLANRFARYDGNGYPKDIKGDDIPIGARILAMVDSFEHLTSKGLEGKAMDMADAMTYIGERRGTLFDPKFTDVFLQVIKDDVKISMMDSARETILVVDTETDFTTLLELKFSNSGYNVSVARSMDEAMSKAKSRAPDMVISDIELDNSSGFDLMEKFKEAGIESPFIILSSKDESSLVDKAFELGAEDVIFKPVKVDVLAAKSQRILGRVKRARAAAAPKDKPAGVSGNLSEMSLPDIIQILGAGGRTGVVSIVSGSEKAEIFLENGRIVNAVLGDQKGEEAFYAIVAWTEGEFTINPDVDITERLIDKSNDSLMLEGFQRLDEGRGGEGGEDIQMDETGDFF